MLQHRTFDRNKHVYTNTAFAELIKDAVRFFNGTPVHTLPPPENFLGTGVYAIYYTGSHEFYKKYAILNRLAYNYPIYVGRAVPRGWRQSRYSDHVSSSSKELSTRLREHARSIGSVNDLAINDFQCRFMIFEGDAIDIISTMEAALIKINKPLWNTIVDGFGNHDPGRGRYEQAKSDWDVIHTGRAWAEKCKGAHHNRQDIIAKIVSHLEELGIQR